MGYPNDFIYLSSLPYHENYMGNMWKQSSQMDFIIINLNEPKSYDLNKLSFKGNIFKCITENSHLYFDQTRTVCIWWNKPSGIIQIYWINTLLKKLTCY